MPSPLELKDFVTDGIYHVFNRGVEKRQIFMTGYDYQRFLSQLQNCLRSEPTITVLAYCLMPNHFHLLLRQSTDPRALSRFMQRLVTGYVMYFNSRYDRVGPLLQGKYKARRVVGPQHLMDASRYIHLNPLEAGLGWWHYQYSSIDAYISPFKQNPLIDTEPVLSLFDFPSDYENYLYLKLRPPAKNSNKANAYQGM